MRRFRVVVVLERDIPSASPEDAAREARTLLVGDLRDADIVVSEDDGSTWEEVGRFSPKEVRR
jgi:hypothetical protein